MNDQKVVQAKSKRFAVRIVKLYRHLCNVYPLYDLFRQILRSGTSIGANIAEADYAVSKKEFLSKMHIALKECSETAYWIDLLFETEYLQEGEHRSLMDDCQELRKLLSSITKTTAESLKEGLQE